MAEHLQIKCDELLKKIEDNNLKAKEKIKIIESIIIKKMKSLN